MSLKSQNSSQKPHSRKSSKRVSQETLKELKEEVISLRKSQASQKENPFRTSQTSLTSKNPEESTDSRRVDEDNASKHSERSVRRISKGSQEGVSSIDSKRSVEKQRTSKATRETLEIINEEEEGVEPEGEDNDGLEENHVDIKKEETVEKGEESEQHNVSKQEAAAGEGEKSIIEDVYEVGKDEEKSLGTAEENVKEEEVAEEIKEKRLTKQSKITLNSSAGKKTKRLSVQSVMKADKVANPKQDSASTASMQTTMTTDTPRGRLLGEIKRLHEMRPRASFVSMMPNIGAKDRRYKGTEHPTYQLAPTRYFSNELVAPILARYVEEAIKRMPTYGAGIAEVLTSFLSMQLRGELSMIFPKRYKISVMVILGEKKYQGFHADCRALWAKDYDSLAFAAKETTTYFLQIVAFGIYKD